LIMVRQTPFELERLMGIEVYLTDEDGVGGDLRAEPDDFTVNEVSDFKAGTSGDHLIVRLTKENWETHHLIRDLSRQLGISEERIGIAGTKDKRAVTTQLMSIRGVTGEQLYRVSLPRVKLEPVGRSNRDIGLGDLRGNDFDITVRHVGLPLPEAERRLKAIGDSIGLAGGVASSAALSYGITYALGVIFIRHFETGGTLLDFNTQKARQAFPQACAEGREKAALPADH